jgi:outer membrane lipoprotein-sorting protein
MRFILPALCLVMTLSAIAQDAKPNIADIKKQIKETESKLADLRSQLAKAEGEPTEFKTVKLLVPGNMEVGTQGPLGGGPGWGASDQKVTEIIDANSVMAMVNSRKPDAGQVIIKGIPTKGMADGKVFGGGDVIWRVVGTEKRGGSTYFVLREAPAKK